MDSLLELLFDLMKSPPITISLTLLFGYGLHKAFKRKENASQPEKRAKEKSDSGSESSSSLSDDGSSAGDYCKLVLIVRNDLKMGKGKVAAQCAHAAVAAYKQATKHPSILKAWQNCGQTKIALKCDNETEMLSLYEAAKAIGLLSYVVRDAGQTQVAPGSLTVCSVGPGPCETIDEITGHLKLY
ncbi:peptidyl-tRNA hydrolase 2, mitochondrial [Copidosoma floridanum]|uniref:peptidyl-tRNA hydrolase 2, mitochondrial n=1 Tax=Copidosoma floridanum TaxID=29053 RepID=UPI0006C989BC|nr:peptidyl-tRNA hydrolase 2, mitochondrial [Copidosoma floridanum]